MIAPSFPPPVPKLIANTKIIAKFDEYEYNNQKSIRRQKNKNIRLSGSKYIKLIRNKQVT
jgi:hypothetical protein